MRRILERFAFPRSGRPAGTLFDGAKVCPFGATATRGRAVAHALRLFPLLFVLRYVQSVHACPMCRDSVAADTRSAQTAESASLNFNTSIYAMLGGFAVVAGFTGRVIFKAVRSQSHP